MNCLDTSVCATGVVRDRAIVSAARSTDVAATASWRRQREAAGQYAEGLNGGGDLLLVNPAGIWIFVRATLVGVLGIHR